jgi:alpha-1,2-mannosyltransferase
MFLAYEAMCEFTPDLMIDSMGYAFTYPLFKYGGGCSVASYVHYPTISTDMLERVRARDTGVCNNTAVAKSSVRSFVKLLYYRAFAFLYGLVGNLAQVVLVNSSWTRGHIDKLWQIPAGRIATVYPPCDTKALSGLPLKRASTSWGGYVVFSLAQFRPEKNHPKQLRAFKVFLQERRASGVESEEERVRLVVAGGCRGSGDEGRLEELRMLAAELGLRERSNASGTCDWDVDFQKNLPAADIRELLAQASVGLHTMEDEHFGIVLVEFMAAGAVVLAHDSAGPAMDIVKDLDGQRTGFLATTETSYAVALREIFALTPAQRLAIADRARTSVAERFSQEAFEQAFSSRMVAPFRRCQ